MIGQERIPCCNMATVMMGFKVENAIIDGKLHPFFAVTRCLCDEHKNEDEDFRIIGSLPSMATIMCQWGRQNSGDGFR
jgi:hypothetical protein